MNRLVKHLSQTSMMLISALMMITMSQIVLCQPDVFDSLYQHEYHKQYGKLLYAGADFLDKTFAPATIDSLLASDNYYDRMNAAIVLGRAKTLDTLNSLYTLINLLRSEINNPLSSSIEHYSHLLITEALKREYMLNIVNLLKPKGKELLYSLIDTAKGDLRQWLIMAATFSGAQQYRHEIRQLYLTSDNGYFRFYATDIMNRFPDTLDIPVLIKALNDDFYVTIQRRKEFQIRGTVAGALIHHGYKIGRAGQNKEENVILEEPIK